MRKPRILYKYTRYSREMRRYIFYTHDICISSISHTGYQEDRYNKRYNNIPRSTIEPGCHWCNHVSHIWNIGYRPHISTHDAGYQTLVLCHIFTTFYPSFCGRKRTFWEKHRRIRYKRIYLTVFCSGHYRTHTLIWTHDSISYTITDHKHSRAM